ncbi:MAG: cyclic nucleotide-binding domain-containing protein [Pseudomonadota bacterium]
MPVDETTLLSTLPPLGLSLDQIPLVTRAWRELRLRTGEMLWEQGGPTTDLGVLASGRLAVFVDGEEIGVVEPGDALGEASAFCPGAQRSASLQATEPSAVLLIDDFELGRLRLALPSFHEAMLDLGLRTAAKRIRATDLRIARMSQGVLPAPSGTPTSGLARLWRALRRATSGDGCPPLLPLLKRQLALQSLPEPALSQLTAAFTPHSFEQGEMLLREGEPGESAIFIASGEVQVLRHVRHRMADVLATFDAGGVLGSLTLVVPGPRTATCQAACAGWLYRMDRPAYRGLDDRPRLAWKACMLATLGLQLRNANALLSGFQAGSHIGGPLPEAQLQRLLAAAGALQGLAT